MVFPFQIEFEPPTRADLHCLLRSPRAWVIFIALTLTVTGAVVVAYRRYQQDTAGGAGLQVNSEPAGVVVEVDGRKRGETPTTLSLSPVSHRITLRRDGYLAASYQVDATVGQTKTLSSALWLQTPQVQRLRPTFPGASIVNAQYLNNGDVVLTLALTPGDERQLWLVTSGSSLRRLGPPDVHGAISASRDGTWVAYLAHGQRSNADQERLDEVWVAGGNGADARRVYALPNGSGEKLVDVAWLPAGDSLLLVSRRSTNGVGLRSHIRRLNVSTGEARDLASLPSDVLPGSYSWNPTHSWVGLLTQAGQAVSLCLLNLDSGEFRYLADLDSDARDRPAFPPLAWGADGAHLVYAAPSQDRSQQGGWLFGSKPAPALFLTDLVTPIPQRLGSVEGRFPAWHPDGRLFALTRAKSNSPLMLTAVGPMGEAQELGDLALKLPATYAVRWDAAHAQAIIASHATGSLGGEQTDYWLARWRPEEGR